MLSVTDKDAQPLCFGSNRRDNSMICQRCRVNEACLTARKEKLEARLRGIEVEEAEAMKAKFSKLVEVEDEAFYPEGKRARKRRQDREAREFWAEQSNNRTHSEGFKEEL